MKIITAINEYLLVDEDEVAHWSDYAKLYGFYGSVFVVLGLLTIYIN